MGCIVQMHRRRVQNLTQGKLQLWMLVIACISQEMISTLGENQEFIWISIDEIHQHQQRHTKYVKIQIIHI